MSSGILSDAPLRATGITVTGPLGALVRGVDLHVAAGALTAIVGESGSGKSLTARALVGLLPAGLQATGSLSLNGVTHDLAAEGAQTSSAWRRLRGSGITLLLQDPFTSLSPMHHVRTQLRHALRAAGHTVSGTLLTARLAEVGLAERVLGQYPHELSGGMRQRVAIALTLAADPAVLLADEPTTALDSVTQAEILALLGALRASRGMSVVLISHDLEVVADHADEVLVMRTGEVVERGATADVLTRPQHEYTRALLAAAPRVPSEPVAARDVGDDVLRVHDLRVSLGGRPVLQGVELQARRGEILGLVGQSGSGKTTLARCIAGLQQAPTGTIDFPGAPPRPVQMVFQDPAGTLNPALTVRRTLREAIRGAHSTSHTPESLLELVSLPASVLDRRPAALSGGQRQRVAIARALASDPALLICDEAVSALDVSVQAQILDLLARLRDDHGQTILFISHDLAVIGSLCDRVIVLNEGTIVEEGPAWQVMTEPTDPYTRTLLAARGVGVTPES